MVGKFDRAWRGRRWLAFCVVLILLVVLPGTSLAQGSLTYGSTVTGSLTAEAPYVIYAFQANEGDQIAVSAMGVSSGMQPGLSLRGPDDRLLVASSGAPFVAEDGRTAWISHRAETTGRYSLLIYNTADTPGDFVLALSGQPSEASSALALDVPTTVNMPPGAAPARYNFTAPQSGRLTLTLNTDTRFFAFTARVYGPDGSLIAGLAGQALASAALSVTPGRGVYEIVVAGLDPETQGAVKLLLTAGAAPPSDGQQDSDLATPAVPVATLDYALPPNFGSAALTSDFMPDPYTVGITSGGPVDVSYLGDECSGFTTSAPAFSVDYTSRTSPTLRFYFIGPGDTTLVINTPGGRYVCVDDSFGTYNPTVDLNSPADGRYDVWVGSYTSGTFVSGTLYVTENTANHP